MFSTSHFGIHVSVPVPITVFQLSLFPIFPNRDPINNWYSSVANTCICTLEKRIDYAYFTNEILSVNDGLKFINAEEGRAVFWEAVLYDQFVFVFFQSWQTRLSIK